MMNFDINNLIGDYDNFRQYWKENTEEDMHRDDVEKKHHHLHLKIEKLENQDNSLLVQYYSGRNNAHFIDSEEWLLENIDGQLTLLIGEISIQLDMSEKGVMSPDGSFVFDGTSLLLLLAHRNEGDVEAHYEFRPCRYFSGFMECSLNDDHSEYHRLGDLVLHDQGAMAELSYQGEHYTVELTQLVFAHKIFLMKVAIYDMPLSEVGINSKAISYTWSSPDAKRLGINIRKLITGWTFIEEGFLSSNTIDLNKD